VIFEDKVVVAVKVPKAAVGQLHLAFNKPFIRVGPQNQVMSPEEQRRKLLATAEAKPPAFTLADFDELNKGRLETFALSIRLALPDEISEEYPFVYVGRAITWTGGIWAALRPSRSFRDPFNKCNFTIEFDHASLSLNATIQGGGYGMDNQPIGLLAKRLVERGLLVGKYLKGLPSTYRLLVFDCDPEWHLVEELDCMAPTAPSELLSQLRSIKRPGLHLRREWSKELVLRSTRQEFEAESVATIETLYPLLCFLKKGSLPLPRLP
jgi:hypothetical protein